MRQGVRIAAGRGSWVNLCPRDGGRGRKRALLDEDRITPSQCRDATACIAESPQSRTLDVETKPSSRESLYVAEAVSVCEHAQICTLFFLPVRLPSIDRNVLIATPSSWSLSVEKERRTLHSLAVGGSEQPKVTGGFLSLASFRATFVDVRVVPFTLSLLSSPLQPPLLERASQKGEGEAMPRP